MTPRVLHADGVVTGDGEALRDGAVVVSGNGSVVEVGQASSVLPRHAGSPPERVRGVILPGLVNAHVHLELSALRGRVQGGAGFASWLEGMLAARAAAAPEDDAAAIDRAIDDLDAAGTRAVGEVTNSLAAVRPLARRGIGGYVFHERFGLRPESAGQLASLGAEVEKTVGAWPTSDLAYAPAPHALFSTHPELVRALLALARGRSRRSTLHLAEHAAERRTLEQGDGPLAEWLRRRIGARPDEPLWPGRGPVELADELGALGPDVVAVHLADARPDELERVARRGSPVVLCPRSNLFIELRLPPLLAMRKAGIEPALGTDSLASNASLDVLAEARALADRFQDVSPRELLQMATWNGARALGRPDLGRIAAGSRPDLFAIEGDLEGDPCAFVLRRVREPRRRLVHREPGGLA